MEVIATGSRTVTRSGNFCRGCSRQGRRRRRRRDLVPQEHNLAGKRLYIGYGSGLFTPRIVVRAL